MQHHGLERNRIWRGKKAKQGTQEIPGHFISNRSEKTWFACHPRTTEVEMLGMNFCVDWKHLFYPLRSSHSLSSKMLGGYCLFDWQQHFRDSVSMMLLSTREPLFARYVFMLCVCRSTTRGDSSSNPRWISISQALSHRLAYLTGLLWQGE